MRGGWFFFIGVLCVLVVGQASAHSFAPGLLEASEFGDGRVRVVWVAPDEAGASLQLRLPCVERSRVLHPTSRGEGVEIWLFCENGLEGQMLEVEGLGASDVVARWVEAGGLVHTQHLHAAQPTWRLLGAQQAAGLGTGWEVLWVYGVLGVEHILGGFDHLLFVLGLWLLVRGRRALVLSITGFTVAHSVTLGLSAGGGLTLPTGPVEATIALSILLLAVELSRPTGSPPTWTQRYPWAVAFGFGLLHGFGFAGALAEVGLPGDQAAVALVGFNLGVECGQLGVLGCAAGLGVVGGCWLRGRALSVARHVAIYGMGAVSVMWIIERI